MNKYRVIIVGGGASGLLSAIELLSGGFGRGEVLILERNDRVGKKLIATGNGQGNLSNVNLSVDNYHGEKSFVKTAFSNLLSCDVVRYLNNLGIATTVDKSGKVYPLSMQASSVLDVLRGHLDKLGCEIKTEQTVTDVSFDNGCFTVTTNKETFYSEKVILAFGGKAGKQFGTDGTSYNLALSFGHKLTNLYPSLVQIKTELTPIKGLKGIKERAKVYAYDGDKCLISDTGDILFTEYGVSGSTVFKISGELITAKNPIIKVEFLPELNMDEVVKIMKNVKASPLFYENPFISVINKAVGKNIIKTAKSNSPKDLAIAIKNFKLKVTGNLGFNYAQVTKGGIDTDFINPITMESKLQRGLYVVGEALNVDGDCGGYNLTFAFASGISAAKDIASKNK